MIDIEQRIIDLKISIPNPPSPVGNYVAYKHCYSTIYISGQLPIDENGNMIKGKIGKDLTLEDGKKAARENAKIYLEQNPQIAAEIEMAIREKAGVIAKKN